MPGSEDTTEGAARAFYVTTPIYYVNDAPHIGHAYTTVAGDVLSRWHRQRGEPVWYLTGTDEHGQKVLRSAEAHGATPQEWTDRLVETAWKPVWRLLDIANDDFIRTTEKRHTVRVQEFWQQLYDAGEVYQGSYAGPYCVGCEEFKLPAELLAGPEGERLCPIHKRPVEMIEEENYFFRLSAYADRLLALYREHPEFVEPASARNEVVRFVEQGLQDLSISRSSFDWGIPIPWDDKHVLYVWIDALLNYVTAVGFGSDEERFARTWPADVHLVGKDILRFHAVIWPAMLMAAGLPLPRKVFANGWLLVGGEKMSKSNLTGISPAQLTDHFGVDAFRYYFLRAIPFGQDGSFSWEDMAARYTSELANDLGNLAARCTAMVERYRGGLLPAPAAEPALAEALAAAARTADERMLALDFQGGIEAVMGFVKLVNGYVTDRQPWQLAKDPARAEELDRVLYATAEGLRAVAVLLHPVMPGACARLWADLGAAEALGPLADQRVAQAGEWGRLPGGARVRKGEALFPRLPEPAP
ncbi:MAG: methionine--tRNA ligase [Actinomycetota bacterium]